MRSDKESGKDERLMCACVRSKPMGQHGTAILRPHIYVHDFCSSSIPCWKSLDTKQKLKLGKWQGGKLTNSPLEALGLEIREIDPRLGLILKTAFSPPNLTTGCMSCKESDPGNDPF
jgi:hypothetical protein